MSQPVKNTDILQEKNEKNINERKNQINPINPLSPFANNNNINNINNPKKFLPNKKTFFIQKIRKKKIINWTTEEDNKLISLVNERKNFKNKINSGNFYESSKMKIKNWKDIAENLSNKTYFQCYSRYQRINKNFSKGSWSKEEDSKLLNSFAKFGKRWNLIAIDMGYKRTSKQIRDRYVNTLDPKLNKKEYTEQEELYLLKCFKIFGKKWTNISKLFPGRTAEMIKNKFYSMKRRKMIDPLNDFNNTCNDKDDINNRQNDSEFENLLRISAALQAKRNKEKLVFDYNEIDEIDKGIK